MINSNSPFLYLILFIHQQIGEQKFEITKGTVIEDDLGITGDDARDFIQNFSATFNVEIGLFEFDKYFYDEPGVLNFQNRKVAVLNVGHLEKAIISGHLNEQTIKET